MRLHPSRRHPTHAALQRSEETEALIINRFRRADDVGIRKSKRQLSGEVLNPKFFPLIPFGLWSNQIPIDWRVRYYAGLL